MASDEDRVLRFISVDKTKEKNLLRASKACKEHELDSEWISASELKDLDLEPQKSVFALERFEGEEFEFLKENACRIVGPQCILSCLQTETFLPNSKHPVYSVAMRGTVVTCTSVPKEEREQLYELIQLMGGTVSKDFTNSVTHLVAGEVGSKKYRVACNVNKAILLPEWVYTCWDLCRDGHISAMSEEFMEYKCPIFKGITLCVTGIDADKRKEIKHLVTEHGGTYSGELNMNTCTHLLVDMPRGEKYEFARRWNLHCVSSQWFYDSVQSGFCLDESNFYTLPDDENNSSQAGRRVSFGLIKGDSAAASKNSTEKTISNKAAQAAYKSVQKHGDKDLLGSSGNKKSLLNQSKRFDNVSRLGETHLDDGESSEFDVQLQPGNMFLDGCKIFLSGFSGQRLEKLRKIINCGGGTRFNQINEIVSHVIIGDKVDSDVELLTNCDFQGFVVSVKWILDCAREGKKLAEEDYLCSDVTQQQELSPSCQENEDPTEKLSKVSTEIVAPLQKLSDNKKDFKITMPEEDVFDDDVVFQQYMPQNVDCGASKPEQNLQPSDNSGQLKDQPSPSADPDATLDEDEEPEHDGGLLSGRYFTVVGFDEHMERLWQIIESNGGNRAGNRQMADYAIFPMNTVPEDSMQAKQMATFCWLEQSLECGRLLEVDGSFLFKPFSIPKGCQPLKGLVLSISQYTGMERDHMYQLAELLGASCQEHFVRKASRNYQASTHLLCQEPDGKKYAAAKKWNFPVVSREWLFACATSGTLVPIDDYPLGKDNMNVVGKSEAPSLEHPIKNSSSAKETAQNKNMRTAEEEVAMETNDALSAMQPASHQVQSTSTENGVDSGSTQKRAIKRPSIYNRPFRPSFDLADVMEELASPACSSRRSRRSRCSRNSFPLDDFFAENIKQTLEKLGTVAPPTREGEDGDDDGDAGKTDDEQQGEEEIRGSLQQGILADIVLSVSKKLSQQQTELFALASSLGADYRWVYDESCTHLIHQGASNDKTKEYVQARERAIHVVSPHWLYACQEKNERVDESMYPHTFNPKLTLPVLTTGRRMTRSSKAGTVEQEMSPQKNGRSPTKRSDPNVTEKPSKTSDQSTENQQNEEQAVDEQGVAEGTAEEVQHDPQIGAATLESLEAREDFKRQLEAIMDATKGKGRRRSRRNTSSNNSSNVSHNASGNGTSANMSLATRRTSSRLRLRSKTSDVDGNKSSSRIKSRFMATDESEHSQSDTITYDDPAGRMEREKIMAQLKRGCSPSPDFTTEEDEEERGRNNITHTNGQATTSKDSITTGVTVVSYNNTTVERHIRQLSTTIRSEPPSPISSSTPAAQPIGLQIKDTLKPPPVNLLDGTTLDQTETRALTPPKFQLSVMTPQEKIDYSALIEQLGGQVFDTVYFNPDCTHVVVGKPNRNEKYLAAVAAGKWVLHKSYLEASREAGFFVDESSHEWGQDVPGEPFNKLAAAAQRWRLRLREERAAASVTGQSEYSCGAFSGWMVLLCVDKSRQPGFKRLLEAGGAKVSGCRPPFKNTSDFTHAFLDLSKTKVEASDLNLLQEDNVWCLKPDYIAEYLMQEPPPPPQKYMLPELAKPAEPDRPVSSQSRKRKGEDDIPGGDKRARVQ